MACGTGLVSFTLTGLVGEFPGSQLDVYAHVLGSFALGSCGVGGHWDSRWRQYMKFGDLAVVVMTVLLTTGVTVAALPQAWHAEFKRL